jgi:hypothetical protein
MIDLIPLRGAQCALALDYSMAALRGEHHDLNTALEEAWAGLFIVLVRNWPNWPIELWSRVDALPEDPLADENTPTQYVVRFRLSFAGEGVDNSDVAAMLDVVTRGLRAVMRVEPELSWAPIRSDYLPLWAIDDGMVYRLLAPEMTVEDSIYMIGSYAGEPRLFASTLDAWPLAGSRRALGIHLCGVDLGWAFSA